MCHIEPFVVKKCSRKGTENGPNPVHPVTVKWSIRACVCCFPLVRITKSSKCDSSAEATSRIDAGTSLWNAHEVCHKDSQTYLQGAQICRGPGGVDGGEDSEYEEKCTHELNQQRFTSPQMILIEGIAAGSMFEATC